MAFILNFIQILVFFSLNGINNQPYTSDLFLWTKNCIYDYKSKYTKGESDYICPANLDDSLSKDIQDAALRIHNLLDCKVYSRVDFRLDKDNRFWLLEINTLPGMTETSLFPMAAKATGLNFEDLIDKIIKLSLEKWY